MAEIIHSNKVCGISENTNMPVMDDKYFQSYSAYEKCKCINKLKSSLEILAKNKGYGYNTYVNDYKNRYTQNKCDDVFKNYNRKSKLIFRNVLNFKINKRKFYLIRLKENFRNILDN